MRADSSMGYYDGSQAADVEVGAGIHARRPLLHGRLRRFLHQSLLADLRVHAARPEARRRTCVAQLDDRGWLEAAAGLAAFRAGRTRRVRARANSRRMAIRCRPISRRTSRRACRRRRAAIRATPTRRSTSCRRRRRRRSATRCRRKGISWAWYAGAWNAAVKDGMQPAAAKRMIIANNEPAAPYFVTHHQPFNYFARFAPGTADRALHLKDYTDLVAGDRQRRSAGGRVLQAAGHLQRASGQHRRACRATLHIAELVTRIKASPLWTFDGGHRHLRRERRLLGSRAAAARATAGVRARAFRRSSCRPTRRRGFVDHTSYDTTSIIKFITLRFALEPLPGGARDGRRPHRGLRLRIEVTRARGRA